MNGTVQGPKLAGKGFEMNREEVRKIQDKVVKKLIKEGYELEDKLQGYSRPDGLLLSIRDLNDYIFPAFIDNFKAFLD